MVAARPFVTKKLGPRNFVVVFPGSPIQFGKWTCELHAQAFANRLNEKYQRSA